MQHKACKAGSYHIKVEATPTCHPERFKNISGLRLTHSELWMLLGQRDKQRLCWPSLLLLPLEEGERIVSHLIHYVAHDSSLCSSRLMSSQETSTHLSITLRCRTELLSRAPELVAYLYEAQNISAQVDHGEALRWCLTLTVSQTGLLGNLSSWDKIFCNSMENEVQSRLGLCLRQL